MHMFNKRRTAVLRELRWQSTATLALKWASMLFKRRYGLKTTRNSLILKTLFIITPVSTNAWTNNEIPHPWRKRHHLENSTPPGPFRSMWMRQQHLMSSNRNATPSTAVSSQVVIYSRQLSGWLQIGSLSRLIASLQLQYLENTKIPSKATVEDSIQQMGPWICGSKSVSRILPDSGSMHQARRFSIYHLSMWVNIREITPCMKPKILGQSVKGNNLTLSYMKMPIISRRPSTN